MWTQMNETSDSTIAQEVDRETSWTRERLQLSVFLLVLPLANLLFTGTVLFDLGLIDVRRLLIVAVRLWVIFGLAYAVLRVLERQFPTLLCDNAFWRSLLVHVAVIADRYLRHCAETFRPAKALI